MIGWVVEETIGIGIINPRAIKKLKPEEPWQRMYRLILKHHYTIKAYRIIEDQLHIELGSPNKLAVVSLSLGDKH